MILAASLPVGVVMQPHFLWMHMELLLLSCMTLLFAKVLITGKPPAQRQTSRRVASLATAACHSAMGVATAAGPGPGTSICPSHCNVRECAGLDVAPL